MRVLVYFAIFASVNSALGLDGTCGGLLEGNAGKFQFSPEEIIEIGKVCVWTVKLISRQTVQFNLTELGDDFTVTLYEEHNPTQSINPTRLNSSDVGISVDNNGQTLVVVLTQKGSGQGFSFTWDSLASRDPDFVSAANYVNQESGQVLWNRFDNGVRLTLSLNTDQSQSLDVEVNSDFGYCNRANECQCSYVALYEITSDGILREVSVACDRPSQWKVQNLYPNVLAFVHLSSSHSVNAEDFVEIKWTTSKSDVPATTTSTTTPPGPIIITNECGGVVEVGSRETIIEYLPPGGYQNWQHCVWTLLPTVAYSGYRVHYVTYGVEYGRDGVKVDGWGRDGILTTRKILPSDSNTSIPIIMDMPYADIQFSSDSANPGRGFHVIITGEGSLEDKDVVNYECLVLNTTSGSFSYPQDFGMQNYNPNQRLTVVVQVPVINPDFNTEVSVDFTDIEDDSLLVYQLHSYLDSSVTRLIGGTTGSNSEGVPSLTSSSYYPRMIQFVSNDNSQTGKGFSISWKQSRVN